jgi:hypothetical protein
MEHRIANETCPISQEIMLHTAVRIRSKLQSCTIFSNDIILKKSNVLSPTTLMHNSMSTKEKSFKKDVFEWSGSDICWKGD